MRAALIIASLLLSAGCAHPIPDPDPSQAWVDLAPSQDTRLEALAVDSARLEDDRYFQFEPGSRQLEMRYRFDVAGHDVGAGSAPLPRDCRLSLAYDRFSAGNAIAWWPAATASGPGPNSTTRRISCSRGQKNEAAAMSQAYDACPLEILHAPVARPVPAADPVRLRRPAARAA